MKRKLLSMLLVIGLIITLIPSATFATEVGTDNGELDGYIEIRTAKDLYNIRSDMTANYKLMNDIDLTEATAKGGIYNFNGCGWNPIGSRNSYSGVSFTGEFDGQGHTIKGLRIEATKTGLGTDIYVGLFAKNEGTIKNLRMKDVSVRFLHSGGLHNVYAAAVAGSNTGVIQNVWVLSGSVYSENAHLDEKQDKVDNSFVVYSSGVSNGGTLIDCYNAASVEARGSGDNYSIWSTTAKAYAIGLNGKSVTRCVNKGTATVGVGVKPSSIPGAYYEGKRVGIKGTTVNDSYDASILGGSLSNQTILGNITNCYYLVKSSSVVGCYKSNNSSEWISLNQAQMKDPDFFEGFDFKNVWCMSDKTMYKYPQLQSVRNGLTGIELLSEPTNEIVVGTELKYDGAVARVFWEDGSYEDIILTPKNTSGGNTETTGIKNVYYSYHVGTEYVETTFQINVLPVKVKSLSIVSLPKKNDYVVGQEFDPSGLKVNQIKNNGVTEECVDYMLNDIDVTTPGKKTVIVSYNGAKTTFDITYVPKEITELKVTDMPAKTIYDEGEAFDPEGMVITAYYNDNTSTVVTDYTVGAMAGYGDINLPITYDGKTVTVPIYIRKLVKDISLDKDTVDLYEGDDLQLVVTATPEDADNREFVWTSSDEKIVTVDETGTIHAVKEGEATVTVAIKGYETVSYSCKVNVTALKVVALRIDSQPSESAYLIGEKFDPTGLKVKQIYNSGSEAVCTKYTLSQIDKTIAGEKTVTVSYEGCSCTFNVNYYEPQLKSIEVTTLPTKTEYKEGEVLDPKGMIVEAEYDGQIKRKVTTYTVGDINDNGEVVISYQGRSTMIVVTLHRTGGMDELLQLLQDNNGTIKSASYSYGYGYSVSLNNNSVTFSYVDSNTLMGKQSIYWSVSKDKTPCGNGLVYYVGSNDSYTRLTVDNNEYYLGKLISVGNTDSRGNLEIQKQLKSFAYTAMNEIYNSLLNDYDISLTKCGFGKLLTQTDSSVWTDVDETNEVNKLIQKLGAYGVRITVDNKTNMNISYDGSNKEIQYSMHSISTGSSTKMSIDSTVYFSYNTETQDHDIDVYFTLVVDGSTYYKYRASCNMALCDENTMLKFKMYSTNVSAMEQQYFASEINSYGELGSKMFRALILGLDVELGKAYKIDVTKCGFNSIDPYICKTHKWVKSRVVLAPTETKEGLCEYKCSKCGVTKTEKMATILIGWKTISNKKYYYNTEGVLQKGIKKINGYYYFLDKKTGEMKTGWQTDSGKKYYFDKSTGKMKTGKQLIDGKTYFLDMTTGAMRTGLVTIGGSKYYFDKTTGVMRTGMVTADKKTYFFETKTGAAKTGKVEINKKTYFFDTTTAAMKTGKILIGKYYYYFSTKASNLGQMQTGKIQIGKYYYYFSTKANSIGQMQTGKVKIGKKYYYFSSNSKSFGQMQTGWMKIGKKKYYYTPKTGVMKTGWLKLKGKSYYFDKKGVMVTGAKKIGKTSYKFDNNGVCLNP